MKTIVDENEWCKKIIFISESFLKTGVFKIRANLFKTKIGWFFLNYFFFNRIWLAFDWGWNVTKSLSIIYCTSGILRILLYSPNYHHCDSNELTFCNREELLCLFFFFVFSFFFELKLNLLCFWFEAFVKFFVGTKKNTFNRLRVSPILVSIFVDANVGFVELWIHIKQLFHCNFAVLLFFSFF